MHTFQTAVHILKVSKIWTCLYIHTYKTVYV